MNQPENDQIKQLIFDVVQKQKPETTKQLVALLQEQHSIPQEKTINVIVEIENKGLLNFTIQEPSIPGSAKAYLPSSKTQCFWLTIVLSVATIAVVFALPYSINFTVYFRSMFSLAFVLFLPGYTCINLFFSTKVPLKTVSSFNRSFVERENIDNIERVALSIGLSLALMAIVGLVLNYTPWGITLITITLSLSAITISFATAEIIQKNQKT